MKPRHSSLTFVAVLALTAALGPAVSVPAAAPPDGQITFAVHVSLAPTWFDPAETPGVITPFLTLYALHDALVKPMPGNARARDVRADRGAGRADWCRPSVGGGAFHHRAAVHLALRGGSQVEGSIPVRLGGRAGRRRAVS